MSGTMRSQRLGVAEVARVDGQPAGALAVAVADDGDDAAALGPGEVEQLVGEDDVGLAADAVDDDDAVG